MSGHFGPRCFRSGAQRSNPSATVKPWSNGPMSSQAGFTRPDVERILLDHGWREAYHGPGIEDGTKVAIWEKEVGGSTRRYRFNCGEQISDQQLERLVEEVGTPLGDSGLRLDVETHQGIFSIEIL